MQRQQTELAIKEVGLFLSRFAVHGIDAFKPEIKNPVTIPSKFSVQERQWEGVLLSIASILAEHDIECVREECLVTPTTLYIHAACLAMLIPVENPSNFLYVHACDATNLDTQMKGVMFTNRLRNLFTDQLEGESSDA